MQVRRRLPQAPRESASLHDLDQPSGRGPGVRCGASALCSAL